MANLNRYAKVSVTKREEWDDDTAQNMLKQRYYIDIRRYNRTFHSDYGYDVDGFDNRDEGITKSSYKRIMKLVESMHKVPFDNSNYFHQTTIYEWQPPMLKYHYQCSECKSIVASDDPYLNIGCYECDGYDGMPMRKVEDE